MIYLMFHILFADDTTLNFRDLNYDQLLQTCNLELERFCLWSTANRLSINYSKTCCMIVTNRKLTYTPLVKINNNFLEFKTSVIFLGIVLDDSLKFNLDSKAVCTKISRSIGIMYRIRSSVPKICLKTMYYSFVHPYLLYGLVVWGGTYYIHLQPIFILQKRCIRLITCYFFLAHTDPLFFLI